MYAVRLVHGTHKQKTNYMMARQVVIQQKSHVYDDWLFSLMNHTIEWNESIGVFRLNEPIEPIESTGSFTLRHHSHQLARLTVLNRMNQLAFSG
jgi:hypothetical protein